jgi:hypothetical protein
MRDHVAKTLRLMPGAGANVARLQPFLHDVAYEGSAVADADTDDRAKRVGLNALLVQAFGSSRRCARSFARWQWLFTGHRPRLEREANGAG